MAAKSRAFRLAIVLRPRGDDWLEGELTRYKREGIQTIVSMLEIDEAEWLGLSQESQIATRSGLEFLSHPIPDRNVPLNVPCFREFVRAVAGRVSRGQSIGIHCRGSIGRSTLAAAATMIQLGWRSQDALEAIEKARGCSVPDTEEQRAWILAYEAEH